MHRGERAAFDDRRQRLTLRIIQLRRLARSLAVDKPIQPLRIEPQHPVADRLQINAADPGSIASCAAIVNLSQRQKPSRARAISRSLGQQPQILRREISPKRKSPPPSDPPVPTETDESQFATSTTQRAR